MAEGEIMAHLMNIGGRKEVTYHEWVTEHMGADERTELINALAPYAANSSGPVSLEKFRNDFCNLSDEDRKSFIKMIQDSVNFVHNGMIQSEFDAAIQADLDRRNKQEVR
jgi:hypothetical protein